MGNLKVSVVGVGNIGSIHSRIYHEHDKVDLVAVCDIDKEKADKVASKYDCKAYYSVQELLQHKNFEVASMCTKGEENGGDHFKPTMELLEGGIHVLGEKPISNNVDEAIQMVALAKSKNLRYGINLNHRFTPAAYKAKEWLKDGRIGKMNMIDLTMWIDNPVETSPWFHLRALHPHSLNILTHFAGKVRKVQCFLQKGENRKIWSNAQINLLFENGVIGHLRGSYDGDFSTGGNYGIENLEIVGSKGRIEIKNACEVLSFFPRRSLTIERYDCLGGMRNFYETFDSRIGEWIEDNINQISPDKVQASGQDGLEVQNIIEGAITSWETDSIITLEN